MKAHGNAVIVPSWQSKPQPKLGSLVFNRLNESVFRGKIQQNTDSALQGTASTNCMSDFLLLCSVIIRMSSSGKADLRPIKNTGDRLYIWAPFVKHCWGRKKEANCSDLKTQSTFSLFIRDRSRGRASVNRWERPAAKASSWHQRWPSV